MPDLKLASNWKSCGYHYDMRRWAGGNGRISFSFSKGDDNYGGIKRKELDDFCKSLGKTMNLVMYRMEDTERLRSKLRERRRVEDRQKAAFREQRDIAVFQRMERNKRWRECKEKEPSLFSIQEDYAEEEDRKSGIREEEERGRGSREEEEKRRGSRSSVKKLDMEKEERRMKNIEWRRRNEPKEDGEELGLVRRLLAELCSSSWHHPMVCKALYQQDLMEGGVEVYRCEGGHALCRGCWLQGSKGACILCSAPIHGRHSLLEQIGQLVCEDAREPGQEDRRPGAEDTMGEEQQDATSFTFTLMESEKSPRKERRNRRKVKDEPSTVSVMLTSEGEDWEEEARIEELEEQVEPATLLRK